MIAVKFKFKKTDSLQENTIIILHNSRNHEYLESMARQLSKLNITITLYDDARNAFEIPLSTVYYFECVERKVYAYTKKEVYRLYKSFVEIKALYEPYGFYQITKSVTVNTHHILSIKISEECRRLIILDNGEQLMMNRHYLLLMKKWNKKEGR